MSSLTSGVISIFVWQQNRGHAAVRFGDDPDFVPTNNRATTVLRMAATTLRESDSYLGAQFRRFRTRLGPPVAIKAMAAKLARLVYRMLRYGMKYVDQGAEFYETQHRKQQVIHLKRKGAQLGLQIIEVAAAA
jgi:hypothetical protein